MVKAYLKLQEAPQSQLRSYIVFCKTEFGPPINPGKFVFKLSIEEFRIFIVEQD